MTDRIATIRRQTKETTVEVTVNLDGTGQSKVATGIGFFDHMLDALARHSLVDLVVSVSGDLEVDGHHTVEDTGIVLGKALAEAVGDKRGIFRFGSAWVSMDESLICAIMDFSGRPYVGWDVDLPFGTVGQLDTQLPEEFFRAVANNAGLTLHIRKEAGENVHHLIEATFKAFGRALRQAITIDERVADQLPSTKGAL